MCHVSLEMLQCSPHFLASALPCLGTSLHSGARWILLPLVWTRSTAQYQTPSPNRWSWWKLIPARLAADTLWGFVRHPPPTPIVPPWASIQAKNRRRNSGCILAP